MRLHIVFACLFAMTLQAWNGMANAAPNASAPLNGTWQLFKDSDGKVPKTGAVVELTLNSGSFTFKAIQSGETVTDRGTYKVSGRTITFEFTQLVQGRRTGPFSVSSDTLVLPFPMLSEGKGSSTWMTPAAIKSFLAKVPSRPAEPESMPALLARVKKVAEAFGNDRQRQDIAQRAKARASAHRGGEAEAYYAQGAVFFMKGYYREAWYAFASAAVLQPNNALYLHNLATVLQEIGSATDARRILEWVTKNYPNLDPPWGALGTTCLGLKDTTCARTALARAQALAPENGLYDYAMGKVLEQEGKKDQAQTLYRSAWGKGYAGSGKEGGR